MLPWNCILYSYLSLLHIKWKRLSVDSPSRNVPSLSVFSPKSRQRMSRRHDVVPWRHMMTKWHHIVTSRDVMTLHHIMSYDKVNLPWGQPIWKSENHIFQPSDLDLWPWPSDLYEILSRSIPPPNFESVCSTVQTGEFWQTHRHTHRQDGFHTLDRWRGREKSAEMLLLCI